MCGTYRGGPGSRPGRHWCRFSPSTSVSTANHHSANFSIIIITRDSHNRPIGGRSAEWTQLHYNPHYINFIFLCVVHTQRGEPGYFSLYSDGLPGSIPCRCKMFLFLSTATRPALGPTHILILCIKYGTHAKRGVGIVQSA
jgi:hypothetical protein